MARWKQLGNAIANGGVRERYAQDGKIGEALILWRRVFAIEEVSHRWFANGIEEAVWALSCMLIWKWFYSQLLHLNPRSTFHQRCCELECARSLCCLAQRFGFCLLLVSESFDIAVLLLNGWSWPCMLSWSCMLGWARVLLRQSSCVPSRRLVS